MPDLGRFVVFLPASNSSPYFRARLLEHLPASRSRVVIPPWLGTVKQWVNEFTPLPDSSLTVISEQARRLMFIEALEQYPSLFKDENKWQVTLALLKLFDELSLHSASVSDSSDEWTNTVQRAYGIEQRHAHLEQEASLIHTLWHAWHQQLHAEKLLDSTSAYILRLRIAQEAIEENQYFFLHQQTHSHHVKQLLLKPCAIIIYAPLSKPAKIKTRAQMKHTHSYARHLLIHPEHSNKELNHIKITSHH